MPHPYFVADGRRPMVTLPMSPGRHRWELMLHPGEDAAPFLEPAAVRRMVEPWLDGETVETERAVVYTFHTRTAARWRRGRVLLAGDAAHVMPPFSGQGFSSGARDAANLAWKLASVLAGAPAALLDTYEQERRPHMEGMQRLSEAMRRMVQATGPRAVRLRDAALTAIDGTAAQRCSPGTSSRCRPTPPARSPPRPRGSRHGAPWVRCSRRATASTIAWRPAGPQWRSTTARGRGWRRTASR